MSAQARLLAMIESLSGRGDRQENLIRHGVNYCLQYLQYLSLALIDFGEANSQYLAISDRLRADQSARGSGTYQLTPEEQQLYAASVEAMILVHYRIETFYLFAKILLDRIADTLLVAYGLERPEFGSSHFALRKLLTNGRAADWNYAAALRGQVEELQALVDFKTRIFEHRREFRQVRAISIGEDRQVRVAASGILYPEPTDQIEALSTENLQELSGRLERYVDTVASFIEGNVDRSILLRPSSGKGR